MSYLDDMRIVGKRAPAAGAFRRLCVDDEGVRSIGLEPRLPKCGIYRGCRATDSAPVSPRLARLWGQQSTSPTPWGDVQRRWRRWWTHWCTYHSMYSPSSCSCVPHCKHACCTLCGRCLARRWRRTCTDAGTDAAVWRAAAAVLDLPPGVSEYGADIKGPEKVCSTLGRQMMLPLRHGGLGLHMQSD